MSFHGRICHYGGMLSPSLDTRGFSIFVYIHVTNIVLQTQTTLTASPRLRADILRQLTGTVHGVNSYVQSILSVREQVENRKEPNNTVW